MKLRCDLVVVVAATSLEKKPANRDIRNSGSGRIVCQDCEQKNDYKIKVILSVMKLEQLETDPVQVKRLFQRKVWRRNAGYVS